MVKRWMAGLQARVSCAGVAVICLLGWVGLCGCDSSTDEPAGDDAVQLEEPEIAPIEQDPKNIGLWPQLGHAFGEVVFVRGEITELRGESGRRLSKRGHDNPYRLIVESIDGEPLAEPVSLEVTGLGEKLEKSMWPPRVGPIQGIGFEIVTMFGVVHMPHKVRSLSIRVHPDKYKLSWPASYIGASFVFMEVLSRTDRPVEPRLYDTRTPAARVGPCVPRLDLPFCTGCRVQGELLATKPGEKARRDDRSNYTCRPVRIQTVNETTLSAPVPFEVWLSETAAAGSSVDLVGYEDVRMWGCPPHRVERFFSPEEVKALREEHGSWQVNHHFWVEGEVEGEKQ